MKNNIKNIAAIIISGLFFIPVFCSAQFGGNSVSEIDNIVATVFTDDKSQAEVEAIEQILYMEAMSELQKINFRAHKRIRRKMQNSISNYIIYKSQAESEAAEELQYMETISALRQVNISDHMQVMSSQFTLSSNILATNYDTQISVIQNRR